MFVSYFYLLMIVLILFRFCCVSFRFVSVASRFVSFLVLQSPVLIAFYNLQVLKKTASASIYVINIPNDVIGLVLRENGKSKQVTDFIA